MPIGDAQWLAQTLEPTLEPDLPICDPHHHLWVHRPEPPAYQQYLLAELAEFLPYTRPFLQRRFCRQSG